jgi:dTDP-4-amino-4,6-dideoxygalactose transaminase
MPVMNKIPAILGGRPAFPEGLPFNQPTLPEFDRLIDDVRRIFSTKNITNGEYVREFEKKAAEYLGVKHAVAVSSCTSGLMLIMKAMELEGEVIVPSFTFSATVQSLVWNNIKPVFADIDAESFNINAEHIEDMINEKTRAIVAVHVFGMPADVGALEMIAGKYGLKLIFDAAHAFGSMYHGSHIGRFGDAEVFSLSPTKLLSTGEGGIVATNNDILAEKIRIGRDYANPGDYNCQFPGLNARMPEFNAILGLKNLETIDEKVMSRHRLVKAYKRNLEGSPGISFQEEKQGLRSTYKDFSIYITPDQFGLTRDELAASLDSENIRTKKYYFPPVHRQKFFTSLFGSKTSGLPVTEEISQNILSLPIFSHMTEDQVTRVCEAIAGIHENCRDMRGDHEDQLLPDLARVH